MTPDATPLLAAHSVTTRNVVHCMDAYTVGSHCTGVGGFDLAFEAAGFVIAYQVEIDDFCNRVLEKHWPGVPRFRDERDCGKHNLPVTDVFVCSFPCQDISVAGKGAGIQAGRSEEHTSELQSRPHLVCRLLLEIGRASCRERV